MSEIHAFPRIVRPASPPLGLYFRPGRNDHRVLMDLISTGKAGCFGVVFEPTRIKRHSELLAQVLDHKLDAILDPDTQQSALTGSYTDELGSLPWGAGHQHQLTDFVSPSADKKLAALANFALKYRFTEILAPTHLLRSADDPWLHIDIQSTRGLRNCLDATGGKNVPIIYSLAIPYSTLRDTEQRSKIIEALEAAPIEAVWLKVDGLGATSTPTAALNYIKAASDFHELGVPIVADHMGGIFGLSLMAFGAVSGIAHGITLGERFSANSWRNPREGKGFAPAHRVYFPDLDLMLSVDQAQSLLNSSSRARSQFGCRDTSCCPRGIRDLLENPGRHFLVQRIEEISGLSRVPEALRPQQFLDQRLRPTTDRALAAATADWEDSTMAKKTRENRKRLDALRVALGELAAKSNRRSFARLPETRVVRDSHISLR